MSRGLLKADKVGAYSATDQMTADIMSDRLLHFVPKQSTITNATASVGGNTLSFARTFRHVDAIELDPTRTDLLCQNLRAQGLHDKVQVWQGDALRFLMQEGSRARPTVIFVDPPWGGPEYKRKHIIEGLYLSGMEMAEVVCGIAERCRADFVALKLPVNYDVASLCQRVFRDGSRCAKLVWFERFPKMLFVVFEIACSNVPHVSRVVTSRPTPCLHCGSKQNASGRQRCPAHKRAGGSSTAAPIGAAVRKRFDNK